MLLIFKAVKETICHISFFATLDSLNIVGQMHSTMGSSFFFNRTPQTHKKYLATKLHEECLKEVVGIGFIGIYFIGLFNVIYIRSANIFFDTIVK